MYSYITFSNFVDTFRAMGRLRTRDGGEGNFTYDALRALFDYLEELEYDIGEDMQLDPIALCCQFSQYEDAADAVHAVDRDVYREVMENNDPEESLLDWLRDQTTVIKFNGGIIIDSEF